MFHRVEKLGPLKQTIFTLFIGIAVVAFWRGAWGIMDSYLFPNNYKLSSWFSILIGLLVLYFTNYWTKELA